MWLLLACAGPQPDSSALPPDSDTAVESRVDSAMPERVRFEGPGGSWGFRVALVGDEILVSAPWAEEGLVTDLDGDVRSRGGRSHGVALAEGASLVPGEPFSDDVRVARDGIIGTRDRVTFDDQEVAVPYPLADAVRWNGEVVLGFARGPDALWIGDRVIERTALGDEAGASLCVDGDDTLFVGAPGSGQLLRLEGDELVEVHADEGRFGHALACADDSVLVGAPEAVRQAGELWRIGEEVDRVMEGLAGDRLGTSLAWRQGVVYAGAPGGNDADGAVVRGRLE